MNTYLKSVTSLDYADPIRVLIQYRRIEIELAQSELSENVKSLRTSTLKSARESREAALFAVGLGQVMGTKVCVAPNEGADYDFVLRWMRGDRANYCPVQLKELVSAERNIDASLLELLQRLHSRPMTETVLLIRVNRNEDIDLSMLPLSDFPYRELWFFWQSTPDASQWSILGDALKSPYRTDFEYPQTIGESSNA